LSEEQLREVTDWLKSNKGPPAKVFEKLNDSFYSRKAFLKTAKAFSEIIKTWPRLFDVDSAVRKTTAYQGPRQ